MTGKIFPESSNVYQDQAKILFNYYQQVAEKIVKEEKEVKNVKSFIWNLESLIPLSYAATAALIPAGPPPIITRSVIMLPPWSFLL